jgi:hypothetical protein
MPSVDSEAYRKEEGTMPMPHINVNISPEFRKRLKQFALDHEMTMTEVVMAALEEYMEREVKSREGKLDCPLCRSPLKLSIGYTGCDWLTVAGKGSGYGYDITLACTNDNCGAMYPIGHIKRESDFTPMNAENNCLA